MADPALGAQLRHRRRPRHRDHRRQRPRRLAARPPAPRLRRPLHPVPGARRASWPPPATCWSWARSAWRSASASASRNLRSSSRRATPRSGCPGRSSASCSPSLMRRVGNPLLLPLSHHRRRRRLLPGDRAPSGIGLDDARDLRDCCSARSAAAASSRRSAAGSRSTSTGWAIAAQAPSILTIVGLTSATALLSASALEVAIRHPHRPRPRPARHRPLQPRLRGRRRPGRLPCPRRDAAGAPDGLERAGQRPDRRRRLRRALVFGAGDLGRCRSASSRS